MLKRLLVILLLLISLNACSTFKKSPTCKIPYIQKPEPIWAPNIDIKYNADKDIYFMNERSMKNLNNYLIDINRYVKNTNSIIETVNKGVTNEK